MKKMMFLWGFIAISLIGFLTFIGLRITKMEKPYRTLESEIKRQADSLIGEYPAMAFEKDRLTSADFAAKNYNINLIVNGDPCDMYVKVENAHGLYKATPYIKCQKYTTKGYGK